MKPRRILGVIFLPIACNLPFAFASSSFLNSSGPRFDRQHTCMSSGLLPRLNKVTPYELKLDLLSADDKAIFQYAEVTLWENTQLSAYSREKPIPPQRLPELLKIVRAALNDRTLSETTKTWLWERFSIEVRERLTADGKPFWDNPSVPRTTSYSHLEARIRALSGVDTYGGSAGIPIAEEHNVLVPALRLLAESKQRDITERANIWTRIAGKVSHRTQGRFKLIESRILEDKSQVFLDASGEVVIFSKTHGEIYRARADKIFASWKPGSRIPQDFKIETGMLDDRYTEVYVPPTALRTPPPNLPTESLARMERALWHASNLDAIQSDRGNGRTSIVSKGLAFLAKAPLGFAERGLLWRRFAHKLHTEYGGFWTMKESSPRKDGSIVFVGSEGHALIIRYPSGNFYRTNLKELGIGWREGMPVPSSWEPDFSHPKLVNLTAPPKTK